MSLKDCQVGDKVMLVPTQGCYQEPVEGEITHATPKFLDIKSGFTTKRYVRETGMPFHLRNLREFPCFKAELKGS